MIYLLGDIHGEFQFLPKILKDVPKDAIVIQVGDFGFYPGHLQEHWARQWKRLERERPIYAIDGNHEHHWMIGQEMEDDPHTPKEFWEGVIFIPRGHVMELDGLTIGFLGGAASVDKKMRWAGVDWFPQETVQQPEFNRLVAYDHVDMLVTHAPPDRIIQKHFDPAKLEQWWGLPRTWKDPSALAVEDAWDHFGNPPLFCGHMHKSIVDGTCRILNINELIAVDPNTLVSST